MDERNEFVIFRLNQEFYGINIKYVENIEKIMPITRVPYTDSQVKGVINLRGIIVPIIDVRVRFGMEPVEPTENTRIIIINLDDIKVGLLVDSSAEVLNIYDTDLDNAPAVKKETTNEYVQNIGVKGDRLIMIVDIKKILSVEE